MKNKQQTIEEMATRLHGLACGGSCHSKDCRYGCRDFNRAGWLVDADYGNIPQALGEFADFLKDYARQVQENGYDGIGENDIDEKLKEFLNR